ncbi:GTPase IMAP family member 3-like [Clarias gariepinus]|uniref:GTPase IMAP family member 3-like n=1 Tax=Clarias gariepinus TaxID=13013 RepID=UPI00234CFE83|nr:GTPase IMAP family member 3-like [Clarias gariepinus]
MSEVRIVLLGEDVLQTNRVGNFILSRSAFQTKVPSSVKLHCERANVQLEGRSITIINTPHLYNPQLSQEELTQRVKECITLTDPGPHVFLLVLQSGTLAHERHDRVRNTLETYSPLSRERSIVITTGEDHGVISECEVRHHRIQDISAFDKRQVLQLLGKIDMLLKETGGTDLQARKATLRSHQDYLTEDTSKTDGETLRGDLEENKDSKLTPHLKLVMLGMKGVKTSISNLLLSENPSQVQTEHSLMCVKQGEVCGNLITLVEIPAFFNSQLSEQEVMRLTLHCVSICDPGVHAFLIAVPGDALTDEEQSDLEMFQSIFGSRVHDHTIFLINQQSQREQLHESLHSVIKACGGRYGFYSSRTDAAELITRVKDLLKENCSHLYTMAMYTYEQIQTQLQYKSEKEYLQQMSNQTQGTVFN